MMASDLFQLELDSPLAYLLEHGNKMRITSRRRIAKARGLACDSFETNTMQRKLEIGNFLGKYILAPRGTSWLTTLNRPKTEPI